MCEEKQLYSNILFSASFFVFNFFVLYYGGLNVEDTVLVLIALSLKAIFLHSAT